MIPCRACEQPFQPHVGQSRYCPDCQRTRARDRMRRQRERDRLRRREMATEGTAGESISDEALWALENRDYAALRRLAGVA
jgi:hypothetical protein